MELSPRLKKIADLVPSGTALADVGTDHAYIPVYCQKNNITKSCLAMDVNAGPLERARVNIIKYGLEDKIHTRLSDGLACLGKGEADVIVIAGMGGLLIKEIIENGKSAIDDSTFLLLQPMIAPCELRSYLYGEGFNITDEYVVREENKFYNIFAVRKGEYTPTDKDIYLGKNILKNSPDTARAYLEYKIRVSQNITDGMKKSDNPDFESIKYHENQLMIFRSALKEMSK